MAIPHKESTLLQELTPQAEQEALELMGVDTKPQRRQRRARMAKRRAMRNKQELRERRQKAREVKDQTTKRQAMINELFTKDLITGIPGSVPQSDIIPFAAAVPDSVKKQIKGLKGPPIGWPSNLPPEKLKILNDYAMMAQQEKEARSTPLTPEQEMRLRQKMENTQRMDMLDQLRNQEIQQQRWTPSSEWKQ